MANTNITDAAQAAAADAVVDLVDGGSTNAAGRLRIYDDGAAQPSDADDAVPAGSTLLVEFVLANPAFGNADTTGTAALAGTPLETTADAGGTALWFRVVDLDEAAVFDGDISESGGGGDMILSNTNIDAGQTVSLDSLEYRQPA